MAATIGTLAAAMLTSCGSSSGGASTSSQPSAPPSSAASTYATQAEAVAATCSAFNVFFADLNRLTPHGSQMKLIADAQDVQEPLIHTDEALDDAGRKLFDDVDTFVMHIGSSSWPETGTPVDPEITAVSDDCAAA